MRNALILTRMRREFTERLGAYRARASWTHVAVPTVCACVVTAALHATDPTANAIVALIYGMWLRHTQDPEGFNLDVIHRIARDHVADIAAAG